MELHTTTTTTADKVVFVQVIVVGGGGGAEAIRGTISDLSRVMKNLKRHTQMVAVAVEMVA